MVGCAVTTMTTAMKKLNGTKGSVKKGDLLVLVDDGACRDVLRLHGDSAGHAAKPRPRW